MFTEYTRSRHFRIDRTIRRIDCSRTAAHFPWRSRRETSSRASNPKGLRDRRHQFQSSRRPQQQRRLRNRRDRHHRYRRRHALFRRGQNSNERRFRSGYYCSRSPKATPDHSHVKGLSPTVPPRESDDSVRRCDGNLAQRQQTEHNANQRPLDRQAISQTVLGFAELGLVD